MKELKETVSAMLSDDYKERFKAEYWQTKIRYEKLKSFCNKLESSNLMSAYGNNTIEAPKHDCPYTTLREQQHIMGELLHILEIRALIEKIDL